MAEAFSEVLERHIKDYQDHLSATRAGQERLLRTLQSLQQEIQLSTALQPSSQVAHASAKLVKLGERVKALGSRATALEKRVAAMHSTLRRAQQRQQQRLQQQAPQQRQQG